jgi:CRISPR-associated endonuclease Cas1
MHTSEQTANSILPEHGVVVLGGYGIKAHVDKGHLILEDGIGAIRKRGRFARVGHGLRRLVVIGSDGMVSLAALRWLSDQGAALAILERDGKVLTVTGPVRPSDARLRRAQALASHAGADVVIARELISQKLAGQEQVARKHLNDSDSAEQIGGYRLDLAETETMDAIRTLEARGAAAYWAAWSDVQVTFPKNDLQRVPDHWRTFGARKSLLTGSRRLATNPPNAILNYLYAILEAESRLAAAALGLDPGLGFIHNDAPARDSLACDLMEAVRPSVDAYLLRLLRGPISRSSFFEERSGNCRLMASLAAHLAQTAPMWARAVAPVAEWVAKTLWAARHKARSGTHLPTRLTQQHKREAKGNPRIVREIRAPRPENLCRNCGKALTLKGTVSHCRACELPKSTARLLQVAPIGRIKSRSPEANLKRGATQRQQRAAQSAWSAIENPPAITREVYRARVMPIIRELPSLRIARAIGVTASYAAMIRKGYLPHPRHWDGLAQLAGANTSAEHGAEEHRG